MKEKTELLIRNWKVNRKKKHRNLAFVTALAMLTVGTVFWDLRETGTAITQEQLCGLPAHQHTADCYDDSGGTPICGLQEHIHTSGCYTDPSSAFETFELIETAFTGDSNAARHEQIALIAESELGYAESSDNFIIGEDGSKQGYTRYGKWYGNPYGDWNTMFTYFCLYHAGVSAEEIPYGGNARTWQVKLSEQAMILPPDSKPERGGILLLDTDANGEADRTGIITGTESELTVIEGDYENAVAEVKYPLGDARILGYVALPETQQTAEAKPEINLLTFRAESASGIQVNASAEEGAFPENAVMTVSDIAREDALKTAAEQFASDADTLDAVAVDISFTDAEGKELEPADGKTVKVQITLPEEQQLSGGEYSLLHVSDEGEVVQVEEAEVSETGAEFEAESFSIYILTSNETYRDVTGTFWVDGHSYPNEAENPYILYLGDTFTLRTVAEKWENNGNAQGFPYGNTEGKLETVSQTSLRDEEINGVTQRVIETTYRAIGPGSVTINLVNNHNWEFSHFYVSVRPHIYIMREFDDRDSNMIKEYLSGYNLPYDADKRYIYNDDPFADKGRPYTLRLGDKIYVYSDYAADFSLAGSGSLQYAGQSDDGKYTIFEAVAIDNDYKDTNNNDRYTMSQIQIKNGDEVLGQIFVRVIPKTPRSFSHCDMEISDDGIYTFTQTVNGQTRVTVYKACVTQVNKPTVLYKADGTIVTTMPVEAYVTLGKPGETQYELTSAYYAGNYSYEGDTSIIPEGTPVYNFANRPHFWEEGSDQEPIHSQCFYNPYDVDHVVFDVGLKLMPDYYYIVGEESVHYDVSNDNTNYPDIDIDSKIFELSGQSMIDAMNKCPLSNGYDFTVRIRGALIQLQAEKTLEGGTLQDGQFTFDLNSTETINQRTFETAKITTAADQTDAQIRTLSFAANQIFPDYKAGDSVKAFILFEHTGFGYGSSFDSAGFNARYPQYASTAVELATWIDKFNNDDPSDDPTGVDKDEFFTAISQFVRNPILSDANGNFDLSGSGNGHYFFWKDSKVTVPSVSATNSAPDTSGKGDIIFPIQSLNGAGTYTFEITEQSDPDDPDIEYDTTTHQIEVTVDDDMNVTILYDGKATPPTFKNKMKTYRLPDTGGSGTAPYVFFGTGLMGTAVFLLKRKQKEAC